MPPEFALGIDRDGLWVPALSSDSTEGVATLARLRKGITLDQANAELRVTSSKLATEYPGTVRGWTLVAHQLCVRLTLGA